MEKALIKWIVTTTVGILIPFNTSLGQDRVSFEVALEKSLDVDCFSRHIADAVAISEERRELYSLETNGKSEAVSDALIRMQRVLLLGSSGLDSLAEYWQNRGVPVFCVDFVDMVFTPEYTPKSSASPLPTSAYRRPPAVRKTVFGLLSRVGSSTESYLDYIQGKIDSLADDPQYHCMERHLLESIGRTVSLLPYYENQAKAEDLKSPRLFLNTYLRAQILGLFTARHIDKLAGPLQMIGSKIVCQDIPKIDWVSLPAN